MVVVYLIQNSAVSASVCISDTTRPLMLYILHTCICICTGICMCVYVYICICINIYIQYIYNIYIYILIYICLCGVQYIPVVSYYFYFYGMNIRFKTHFMVINSPLTQGLNGSYPQQSPPFITLLHILPYETCPIQTSNFLKTGLCLILTFEILSFYDATIGF